MADIVEIIISAIDKASPVFSKIGSEVEAMASEVDSAVDSVDADKLADEFKEVDHAIDNVDSNSLDKLGNDVQEDKSKFTQLKETITSTFESAKGIVTGFGSTLQETGGKVTGLIGKVRELKNSINYAGVGATNAGTSFGFLRDAASMTVGMIGYDLVNGFIESGRAAINARSQFDYFAGRLKMNGSQVASFKKEVSDMQKEFRKVDMTAVAATAEEIAVKNGLAADKVSELTRVTAVMSSTFVKEGRTQEDAILAVSDALDGQFKRLQEIGITREDLMAQGWNGDLKDQEGLIKALSKTMEEMGYEQTAKDITNLDEAFNALSISGGQLLADILVPLAPTLIGIMEGAMTAADGISGFIGMVQGAFSGMPDWAQIGLGVTVLGIAFGLVGTIILSTYVPGMVASVISTINWIATALGAEVSAITLSGAFGLLATSIWAALAPLLPFIALAALIVVAVYEIGKSFGWWSDIGSMLSAIQAGIMRLWNAFINHPDVQAAIKAIGDALQAVGKWVGWAGQQVLQFFGISSGGNWDIVSSIIHGIGDAWNFVKGILSAVSGAVQSAQNQFGVFGGFLAAMGAPIIFVYELLKSIVCILLGCSPGIVPALQLVQDMFSAVWESISSIIGPIIGTIVFIIQSLIYVFDQFRAGQITLPQLVMSVLSLLWTGYTTIITQIVQLVIKFGSQLLSYGLKAGSNFLNSVMNHIRQLPSRIYSSLIRVVSMIISAGAQWISNAVSQASSVVSGVVGRFSSLPSQISSALSGVVSAITQPFRSAYDSVCSIVDNIKSKVQDGLSSLSQITGFGGDTAAGGDMPSAYGGDILPANVEYTASGNSTVTVEGEVTERLILDFQNVPSHIDTDELIKAMQDKKVLASIARNRDFQSIDSKVKNEIIGKSKRYYGV